MKWAARLCGIKGGESGTCLLLCHANCFCVFFFLTSRRRSRVTEREFHTQPSWKSRGLVLFSNWSDGGRTNQEAALQGVAASLCQRSARSAASCCVS